MNTSTQETRIDINEGNFNSILNGAIKGTTRIRDTLQLLLCFALAHYAEHANTVYLTKILNACVGVKALPTRTMKEFIQAHANVTWTKTTDNSMVFKKQGKEVVVSPVTTLWYDFSKDHQAMPDVNILARFNGLFTALNNAINDGKIKDGQEAFALKLRDTLESLKNEADVNATHEAEAQAA